jgi:RNA polymerase sigma-70 factor (sigma-E family)
MPTEGRKVTIEPGFAEFVQVRYAELLRLAYLLTGSAQDAEDLVQSALLSTMRAWHRIEDPLPYLRRTMTNLHISRWRRHRAREFLTSFVPDRQVHDGSERITERQALWTALRQLSPRTRAVIVLRYWADLSEADTAQVLGCSVGSIKSTASRGLTRLRAALGSSSDSSTDGLVSTMHRETQ